MSPARTSPSPHAEAVDGPAFAHAPRSPRGSRRGLRRASLLVPALLLAGCPGAPPMMSVEIPFLARVGADDYACGVTYDGLGTGHSSYEPVDFRMYVHDVRLVADGVEHPVDLAENIWQHGEVALLDFEDGTGGCTNGTAETNRIISGAVPLSLEDGPHHAELRFTVGVPFARNHADPTTAPSPLNVTAMAWNWNAGYKFLRLDGTTGDGSYAFHLGSTGCEAGETPGDVSGCAQENRIEVVLPFDPTTSDTVVFDVAALFALADLRAGEGGHAPGCQSGPTDLDCAAVFDALGLPFGGEEGGPQTVFSVEAQ